MASSEIYAYLLYPNKLTKNHNLFENTVLTNHLIFYS